ncbi:MAG: tRNA lysidine(34) synthetase TilS [Eubacterium sp.]
MSEITAKINKTVEKYNMLCADDFVVIGVSGGADSMLLLNYLISRRVELNLRILVANVEHGIRGQESLNDTEFVKQFCKEHNVEFESVSINAIDEAKEQGMTVEEYSRMRRYDYFKSFNPDKIATAHNLSDNVETVLFRLSRGTSIKGCCGIPAIRGNIIRPLLDCTGTEIRKACKDSNIPFVIDSTNSDNSYSRNYIRNQIIPDFQRLNPSFESVLNRFIESVNEDEALIENAANNCFDDCFYKNALRLDKLRKYEPAVIKRAIIKYISLYDVSLDDLHLSGVYNLVFRQGRYQIKKNIFAISDKKRLRTAIFDQTLDFDDVVIKKRITSRDDFLNNCELLQKKFDFYCDYDKIVGEITVRARQEGDEISPAGRSCTKSLKKLYNEYKIPVEDRNNIPVICDEKGVIGIYGFCCGERVKIDNTTSSVILLQIRTED